MEGKKAKKTKISPPLPDKTDVEQCNQIAAKQIYN